MAAISSAGSGNWSSTTPNAPWPSGTVPTSSDDVTIAKNHTVTLDTVSAVANSVTLAIGTTTGDAGGELAASTSVSSKLVVQQGITSPGSLTGNYSSKLNFDVSSSASVSCIIVLNNSNTTGAGYGMTIKGNWIFKGFHKKRHTVISGALTADSSTSAVISDATGWQVGDKLVFATTSAVSDINFVSSAASYSDPYLTFTVPSTTGLKKGAGLFMTSMQTSLNKYWSVYDVVDSTHYRVNVGTGFSLTDGVGTAVLLPKYDEVSISTIILGTGTTATVTWTDGAGVGGAVAFDHADGCPVGNMSSNLTMGSTGYGKIGWISGDYGGAGTGMTQDCYCTNVAFHYGASGSTFGVSAFALMNSATRVMDLSHNVFYNCNALYIRNVIAPIPRKFNVFLQSGVAGQDSTFTIQMTPDEDHCYFGGYIGAGYIHQIYANAASSVRPLISGCRVTDQILYGGLRNERPNITITQGKIWSCSLGVTNIGTITFDECDFGSKVFTGCNNTTDLRQSSGLTTFLNCNLPTSLVLGNFPLYDNSVITIVNRDGDPAVQEIYKQHSVSVPVIQRNAVTMTRSTSSVELTLNGTTAIAHTLQILAKAGETITLKTYVRKNSSYGASTLPSVTVSGLGITPVVSTMNAGTAADDWELLTTSATNSGASDGLLTVTFTAQSSTAGAKAYFSGTPCAPFVTRARHYGYLFQETIPTVTVDPYVVAAEATAVAYTGVTIDGTGKDITFTAGTADTSQKLYDYSREWAALNVGDEFPFTRAGSLYSLTTGWTVIDPYYAGELTWSGGTVQYSSYGTKSDNLDGCIVEFADTGGGTYTLDGVLTGTLDLRNLDADPITVEVPAGTTTTDANNTGGTITVDVAAVVSTALVSGIVSGSRMRIYNVTTATEIFNDIVAGTSYTADYTEGTGYTAGDVIEVRLAWHSGASAKLPWNTRTIASSSGWSILSGQVDDDAYNTNAIDGDTCTEFTADFPNVEIDISDPDGLTTPQRGYAWYISGQLTADGIRYYHGAMTAEDLFNYRVNVDVADMHIQNVSTLPVLIAGARLYRSDGTTVMVAGAGPIQMEYGRVYPIETGVSGLTGTESAKLAAIPTNPLLAADYVAPDNAGIAALPTLAELQAAVLPVNVKKVNDITVTGQGTTLNPWGPV